MIRRLITAWRHADEIAELRDRAVVDAATIADLRRARVESARTVARLDQAEALLDDIARSLIEAQHHGHSPRCAGCQIVRRIAKLRSQSTNQHSN